VKRNYHTIDKQGKAGERKLTEFLVRNGQALLPMMELIEGIGHRHLPPQFSSLFPVQTTTFQPLKSGHPAFRHGILLKSEFRPGLGSACEETTDSPARPGRAFFKALARHQSMHRGSRSHPVKRAQGTNRTSTIACRPGLVTIKSEGPTEIQVSGSIHCPSGHQAAVNYPVGRILWVPKILSKSVIL
jgi:hypothetical protein